MGVNGETGDVNNFMMKRLISAKNGGLLDVDAGSD
jgi:hypothetical protein